MSDASVGRRGSGVSLGEASSAVPVTGAADAKGAGLRLGVRAVSDEGEAPARSLRQP
jgi:hypothetical protein